MTGDEAIEIIAQHAIGQAADAVGEDGWERYPEIGEDDWDHVVEKIDALCPTVAPAAYREALALLAARATP